MLLKGKTAIVTGSASLRGIGWATAKCFVENGARVALLDLDQSATDAAAAELGNGHISIHGPASKLRSDPAVRAAYLGSAH
ncbi:SDR family NAD(P)-dependent oxidoreductase [Pseudomonas sp. CHM02]|uniref:SDR family NAD(P)-dependent oxidoreductase n=1 Tax=Pseudomonas sp. CHM02 TaxID=1463662 RepID=UPI000471DDCF|nr:SDR family NAD(P)-dependent oxidoreductase [Pseudomonas sp. CHM02]